MAGHVRDAGLYIACQGVEGVCRNLRFKGLDLSEPKAAPYGIKQFFLRDPDGYTLCFQWPAEA